MDDLCGVQDRAQDTLVSQQDLVPLANIIQLTSLLASSVSSDSSNTTLYLGEDSVTSSSRGDVTSSMPHPASPVHDENPRNLHEPNRSFAPLPVAKFPKWSFFPTESSEHSLVRLFYVSFLTYNRRSYIHLQGKFELENWMDGFMFASRDSMTSSTSTVSSLPSTRSSKKSAPPWKPKLNCFTS